MHSREEGEEQQQGSVGDQGQQQEIGSDLAQQRRKRSAAAGAWRRVVALSGRRWWRGGVGWRTHAGDHTLALEYLMRRARVRLVWWLQALEVEVQVDG